MVTMKAMEFGWMKIVKRVFGFFGSSSETPAKTSKIYTDQERIDRWAYHHCERENAKWLGTDPLNICPLQGRCPGCQAEAREVILTK